jgi:O-antigen/teichoic acid export membrane protein
MARPPIRKLAIASAAIASSGATTLVFNVAAARMLLPKDFGEVAREWSVAMLVAQLTMAGVSPALARHVGQAGNDGERWAQTRGALRLLWLSALVCSLAYPALAFAGLAPVSASSLLAGWAVTVIYPVYFGMKSLLFVLDRIPLYAKLEVGSDLIFYGLLALFVVEAPHWVVSSFALAYGCFVITVTRVIAYRAECRTTVAVSASLIRYVGFAMLSTYASVARFPAVIAVAGVVTGSVISGHVSALLALLTPLLLIPQAASILTFASFARQRSPDEDQGLRGTVRLAFAVTMGPVVIGVIAARPILVLIYGSQFASLAGSFSILLLGLGPMIVGMPIGNALAGGGAVRTTALIAIPGFLLTIALACVGGELDAGPGILIGTGLGLAINGIALAVVGMARLNLQFKDFADGLLLVAVGAVALVQPMIAAVVGVLAVAVLLVRHLHLREAALR